MFFIKTFFDLRFQNRVGMDEPLVDSDGYPRNDIDVYRVRHARHKIICELSKDCSIFRTLFGATQRTTVLSVQACGTIIRRS